MKKICTVRIVVDHTNALKYGLTQEADIVGNLHERAGNHVERSGDLHHGVMGGQRFELSNQRMTNCPN
jgi:hypothetical protein